MKSRKPYKQRTDLERIESQWRKMSGLHSREEWSAAVIRAATAAEIAANLAIRSEFALRSGFDEVFVNSLLRWANGLSGKMDRLLLLLYEGNDKRAQLKRLKKVAEKVNDKRNAIAHRGEFCSKSANDGVGSCILTFDASLNVKLSILFPEILKVFSRNDVPDAPRADLIPPHGSLNEVIE